MFNILRPKVIVPNKEYMDVLSEALKYSPDISELQKHTGQLLFVYDQLKKNEPRHALLANGSIFFGTFFTHETYSVWDRVSDHTVVAMEDRTKPARIQGELYGVRPSRFLTLDKEKENGYTFIRKRVTVDALCFNPQEVVVPVESWMYLGNPDYWNSRVDNGYNYSISKPRAYNKRPSIGAYHHFETS